MKKKAFTLIELIAVLVILAILALIVTPLVMNIIKKARIAADRRSIDAYGRSVEIAIATYLLDEAKFPTSISDLTIEYSGDKVVCSVTQLNDDSSIYLTGCTVAGRSVDYTYGSESTVTYDTYEIGDEIAYNNIDYYVIKKSGSKESTVTLLKAEPLTVAEVNQYGAGHINRYTKLSQGTAYDSNGYGGMAYYTSETCGYINDNYITDGCINDYEESEVKYVVDAWAQSNVPSAIEARLITYNEVTNELGCTSNNCSNSSNSWSYSSNYLYWTATPSDSISLSVWVVENDGVLNGCNVGSIRRGVVRPVITIKKSALSN